MKTAMRLWNEETGAILSAELMLIASILVIGVIAGLSALREAVVSELADVAQALANVNQSYSYGGVVGHCAITGGGVFVDLLDFCDAAAVAACRVSQGTGNGNVKKVRRPIPPLDKYWGCSGGGNTWRLTPLLAQPLLAPP